MQRCAIGVKILLTRHRFFGGCIPNAPHHTSVPGMAATVRRWWRAAWVLRRQYDQVQEEATRDTLRRALIVAWLVVPMHLCLAFWFFLYQAPDGRAAIQAWADALAVMHAALVLALSVCTLMARRLVRGERPSGWAGVAVQTAFCSAYLAFGSAAAIGDVVVGNGIATFLIVCMGVAVLSLMRPLLSLAVFASAFGLFWHILRGTAIDAALLTSLQIQALSMVLVAQLISVMLWHQYAQRVLLSRTLEKTHAALLAKQQELEALAGRDTLTGLYNRRKFLQLAEQELNRTLRSPAPLCLLMVDLDFFKRINDQYGHPAGDAALQQVAQILRQGVRSTDVLARLGGEEFVVWMPDTVPAGGLAVAEKLRHALRDNPLDLGVVRLPVTASMGISALEVGQHASIDVLYAAADSALYAAKRNGRDRVEYADPVIPPASKDGAGAGG